MANYGRTAAKARFAQVLRNSTRAMPLLALLTSVSQHGCLVFFRCEAVLLATINLLL